MGKYLDIVKRFEERRRTEGRTSLITGPVTGPNPGITVTNSRMKKPEHPPVPYLNERGVLIVPVESHPRYHWWKPGGLSIHQTLLELGAAPDVLARHVDSEAAVRTRQ